MHRLITILLLFLLTYSPASSMSDRFPYVVEVKDRSDMELSDSVFYKISRTVIFPVNIFHIPENSAFYQEITQEIIPEMNARGMRLESIMIRGAASPEGPYKWNQFLGLHRQQALFELIDKNMEQPSCPDCLKKQDIPEDYHYLLYMMAEADDRDYDRVKSYVDKYLPNKVEVLKQNLMALDEGALWKRLLREYFPSLRAARVVLFFRKPEPETIIPEPKLETKSEPLVADIVKIPVRTTGTEEMLPQPVSTARRELLSVKTNLLFDFAYMPLGYNAFCPIPNVAIEYYPLHGHFTYGAMFDCPWWSGGTANHKYFQIRNYTLESRYYFRSGDISKRIPGQGAAFKGWYLQAYAHAFLYGIGWSDNKGFDAPGSIGGHGWQGEGIGGGVGFGYVLPLGKSEHWRLEFNVQLGAFISKYDPYIYGCPVEQKNDGLYYYVWYRDADEFRERQHRMTWFGPTRVGIQISYDLLYRKNNRRGVSFRQKGGKR